MELSTRLREAINSHLNAELYAAYLYLSMAAYCENISMPGFAHWMRLQHQEELSHAMKLFDFLNARESRVVLQAIDQPPTEFKSPSDVAEKTLEHERAVTSKIHRLYELTVEESDYPAQVLLQWFISEQVEEEKVIADVVEHLRLVGEDGTGLLMIDGRLGERTMSSGT